MPVAPAAADWPLIARQGRWEAGVARRCSNHSLLGLGLYEFIRFGVKGNSPAKALQPEVEFSQASVFYRRCGTGRQAERDRQQETACMEDDAIADEFKRDSGCAAPARVGLEYCDRVWPIYFETAAQIQATPAPIRRQIRDLKSSLRALCDR